MQFRFGDYLLDVARRELRRSGELVALEPQVFDLLVHLVRNRDRIVTKDDLLDSVWGGRSVSESTLTSRINAARKAIGDSGDDQRLIRTSPRKGIRFVGDVSEALPVESAALTAPQGRPSIAVLPFDNLSGDPEQEYFADGVVEEIITALSRFKSFAVIARNSSFVYKGRTVDVRQVAEELGVRYVLEGSVRRAGTTLRIAAQLVEGQSAAHLWAEKFDGKVEDIFEVQDRITEGIVAVVEPKIQRAEIDRSRRERPESLDAYDLYLRALQKLNTSRPDDNAAGLELLDRAIAQAPGYAKAIALAANCLQHRLIVGWPAMTANDAAKCLRLAREALAVGGDDPHVLSRCGIVLLLVGHERDQSLQIFKRALAANPNDVLVLSQAGVANLVCGHLDEALTCFRRAIDLSPGDAWTGMTGLANAYLYLGRYEEALDWAGRSRAENPNYNITYWMLIAANAHLGRMDQARHELATLQAMAPGISIARIDLQGPGQRYRDVVIDGLRLAGMPEV